MKSIARELIPLYDIDPIKLAHSPRLSDSRLKLTASAFNWHKPVCQQSWSQGTLLRRARRFFPTIAIGGMVSLSGLDKHEDGRPAKGHQRQY